MRVGWCFDDGWSLPRYLLPRLRDERVHCAVRIASKLKRSEQQYDGSYYDTAHTETADGHYQLFSFDTSLQLE